MEKISFYGVKKATKKTSKNSEETSVNLDHSETVPDSFGDFSGNISSLLAEGECDNSLNNVQLSESMVGLFDYSFNTGENITVNNTSENLTVDNTSENITVNKRPFRSKNGNEISYDEHSDNSDEEYNTYIPPKKMQKVVQCSTPKQKKGPGRPKG